MSDPTKDPMRLLASADITDLERELLSSWQDERPPSAAREKTLAMLGVSGGALAAAGSLAPKAIASGWLAMAKWTVATALAISAIGFGVGMVVRHRAEAPVVSAPIVTPAIPVATNPTVDEPLAPTAVVQNAMPAPTHVASRPVASASLNEQIAAVDRARSALEAGDGAKARKLVDAYESEYPGGAFTQEAEVVRIDALVQEGNHDGAERVGKHFLSTYPKSPHAGRVRALLGYDP